MVDAPPRQYGVDMACYDPEIGNSLEVTLNGRRLDRVISYDIDAGQVVCCKTDEDGGFVLNATRDGIEHELLTGIVGVRFKVAG